MSDKELKSSAENERSLGVAVERDIPALRAVVRAACDQAGLGELRAVRAVTAASEVARNALRYGRGGTATVSILTAGPRRGVRVVVRDEGDGIPNIERALSPGYSSSGTLGLGLPGARRLADEFEIDSSPGAGTLVTMVFWCK